MRFASPHPLHTPFKKKKKKMGLGLVVGGIGVGGLGVGEWSGGGGGGVTTTQVHGQWRQSDETMKKQRVPAAASIHVSITVMVSLY